MVRQYKGMQEQLGKRVADLEAQNKSLREGARLKDEQIAKLQVKGRRHGICGGARGIGRSHDVAKTCLSMLLIHAGSTYCKTLPPGRPKLGYMPGRLSLTCCSSDSTDITLHTLDCFLCRVSKTP